MQEVMPVRGEEGSRVRCASPAAGVTCSSLHGRCSAVPL